MSVMRKETGYRGSRLASKLGDGMHAVRGRVLDGLHRARGPMNDCAVHLRGPPQPEVEPTVVLARESGASVHDLELAGPARDEEHLRPDGAAVRAGARELERDAVIAGRHRVLVDQRRLPLVRHHHVEHAAVEQVDQRDGAAVVLVGHADLGGDVAPSCQAVVYEHTRSLVPRQAGGSDGRPGARVLEQVAVRPGDLRHGVPVALVPVARHVAVGDEQLVAAVVVEIAELCAPGPARVGQHPFGGLLEPAELGEKVEAQVVSVKQVAPFGDVGHEGVHASPIQHIAQRGRHAALGIALEAHAAQHEPLAVVVQVQLFRAVVVGQEQVGPSVAVEIGRGDRQGPARAPHPHPVRHILEASAAEVVEQPVLAAVGRELEAVLHDARRFQVPEVDVGAEIARHVQVEQPVPIVVDPHGPVGVHPLAQPGARGDVLEMEVAQVLEELEIAPLVDQQVLEPVVVVVAPHGAHRHAFSRPVHVGDAGGGGDVLERAGAAIHEQRIGKSEPAVREIKIWPSVVVHVGHRDGRTQGSDERRDVVELRIQGRPVMHEVDAHLGGDVGQVELGNRGIAAGALPAAVQNEHEDDGGQKRRGDGDATPRGGRGNHGVKVIHLSARSAPVIFPPVQTRNLGSVALLLVTACRGAPPPGTEQARSDSALTARTWGLAYLQQQQLPRAEAEFQKVVALAPDRALGYADLGLVYLREGRSREAEAQLRRAAELDCVLRSDSTDIRALYALARLAAQSADPAGRQRWESLLRRVLTRAPANIVARLELVDLLLARGSAGAAAGELEALQHQLPQLPPEAARFFQRALVLARTGRAAEAAFHATRFHRAMELTATYQVALERLGGAAGAFAGYPVLTFNANIAVPTDDPRAVAAALRSTDVTAGSGLEVVPALPDSVASSLERAVALAVGDYDDDATEDLFVAGHLFRGTLGRFVETSAGAGLAFQDRTNRPVAAAL